MASDFPRVEELFEARKPKKPAIVAEYAGNVTIQDNKRIRTIIIKADESGEETSYQIPFGTRVSVAEGDHVFAGQELTEGYRAPADILRINGIDAVYEYILLEVQKVYRSQNIDINDKHIEVIARQMTRKVRIEESGDTSLLSGSTVDLSEFHYENDQIEPRIAAGETGLAVAVASPVLLGITKASLLTESFLSAASFQETTKVLTEAAIKGKVDHLMGLKENVLIGKLIPAGTGMECYRSMDVKRAQPYNDPILAELEMAARESESRRALEDEDGFLPTDAAIDLVEDTADDTAAEEDVSDDDLLAMPEEDAAEADTDAEE